MANPTFDLPRYHRFLRGKATWTSSTTVAANAVTITVAAVAIMRHTLIHVIAKSDKATSVITVTDGTTTFTLPVGAAVQNYDISQSAFTALSATALTVTLDVTTLGHLAICSYADND